MKFFERISNVLLDRKLEGTLTIPFQFISCEIQTINKLYDQQQSDNICVSRIKAENLFQYLTLSGGENAGKIFRIIGKLWHGEYGKRFCGEYAEKFQNCQLATAPR